MAKRSTSRTAGLKAAAKRNISKPFMTSTKTTNTGRTPRSKRGGTANDGSSPKPGEHA